MLRVRGPGSSSLAKDVHETRFASLPTPTDGHNASHCSVVTTQKHFALIILTARFSSASSNSAGTHGFGGYGTAPRVSTTVLLPCSKAVCKCQAHGWRCSSRSSAEQMACSGCTDIPSCQSGLLLDVPDSQTCFRNEVLGESVCSLFSKLTLVLHQFKTFSRRWHRAFRFCEVLRHVSSHGVRASSPSDPQTSSSSLHHRDPQSHGCSQERRRDPCKGP